MSAWKDTVRRRQDMQHQLEGNLLMNLEFMPEVDALTLSYLAVDDQLELPELDAVRDGANFWLEMCGDLRRIFSIARSFDGYRILTTRLI